MILRRATHRSPRCAILTALLLCTYPAAAQSPPPGGQPPAPAAAPTERDLARERFERAKGLFKQENWAAALAELSEANKLYRTWAVTSYSAACLKKLGRFDESLDMYATLIRDFSDKLPDNAKQSALREVEETRKLVGTIEIEGAEPGAAIVVNQAARGDYPLLEPLRVPAGSHIVRVYKEGYEPFEQRLDVAGGTAARVTARLRKLKETGTLQVVELQGRELAVIVDGIGVGKTGAAPVDLPLAPGKHVVFLRGEGNLGTAPAIMTLAVNEVSPLRLQAEVLDASLRVEPTPFDALVSIDSVLVGRGIWDGRLRAGDHRVEIAAPGFLPDARKLTLTRDRPESLRVTLERDPTSPFWRRPTRPPRFLAEAVTSAAIVPAFGGDVVGACSGVCQQALGSGGSAVIHAGYELGVGLGFGVTAGYLAATQSLTHRSTTLAPTGLPPSRGTVDDRLALRGALLGGWIGLSLLERVPLRFRLGAGVLVGSLLDERSKGSFLADDGAEYALDDLVQRHPARFFYVTPEVRVALRLGRGIEVNAGVAVNVLVDLERPRWDTGQAVAAGTDGYGAFAADTLTSPVLLAIAPGIGAHYEF